MQSIYVSEASGHLRWIDMSGDGPPHVFLHDLGRAGSADFPGIASQPGLAGKRSLIPDLFGHGFSDAPGDFTYTLEAHAETVAALLDHVRARDCVLIGDAMGGAVCVVLATRRPELFSRVVVTGAALCGGGLRGAAVASYSEAEFVSHGFRSVLAGSVPEHAARIRTANPTALHRSAVGWMKGRDSGLTELFLKLPQPKALVRGAHSRPRAHEDEVRAAGVPVIEVPGTGVELLEDDPARFASALAGAISTNSPAWKRNSTVGAGNVGSGDIDLVWPTEANPTLLAGVHAVIAAVTEQGGALGYHMVPGREETDAWLEEMLADVRSSDAALAVAVRGDDIVGCGLWQRHTSAASYRHSAEIPQLMSHPEARGLGIGRLLVTALVKDARRAGLELLTLGVRGNNHGAIALYEQLGFREWGRLPSGVAVANERFDDVKMCLELGRPDDVIVRGSAPVGPGSSVLR